MERESACYTAPTDAEGKLHTASFRLSLGPWELSFSMVTKQIIAARKRMEQKGSDGEWQKWKGLDVLEHVYGKEILDCCFYIEERKELGVYPNYDI